MTEVRRRDQALLSQGRDHPGDPPPGEEQPADGGRAAAHAGPPVGGPVGAAGAERVRPPGRVDRHGARDAVDLAGRPGGPGPDRRPAGADDLRCRGGRDVGPGPPGRHLRHPRRRAGDPVGHGARGGRAERSAARLRRRRRRGGAWSSITVERSAKELDIVVSTTGSACRTDSPWSTHPGSACRSCARWSRPNCSDRSSMGHRPGGGGTTVPDRWCRCGGAAELSARRLHRGFGIGCRFVVGCGSQR